MPQFRAGLAGLCLALLVGCGGGPEPVQQAAIRAPTFFMADALGPGCTRDNRGAVPSIAQARAALRRLDANHQRYIDRLNGNSTSLFADKDAYEGDWEAVLFNAYAAAARNDAAGAHAILDGLARIAQKNRYLFEPGLVSQEQVLRSGRSCYARGPNARCDRLTPVFVARMHANLQIAAAVLGPYATDAHRAVLTPWFEAAQERFIAPQSQRDQAGLYDLANLGMGRLAWAAWTDDLRLARREISFRRQQILDHIEPSGYIDENSYRGVRGFWYHTYGLDPFLSFALLSRSWGVDLLADPAVNARFRAALEKTALGIRDHAAFRSVGNRGDSYSTDPRDTRDFMHQYALNLYQISEREFGLRLPRSARHDELRRDMQFTVTSGFLASCYYSR